MDIKRKNDMEAPDKIFLPRDIDLRSAAILTLGKQLEDVEYIRKDIVDDTLESAEDHAFFAGRENFRENTLEWAKKQASITNKLNGKGAMLKAWNTLIEKLNSM